MTYGCSEVHDSYLMNYVNRLDNWITDIGNQFDYFENYILKFLNITVNDAGNENSEDYDDQSDDENMSENEYDEESDDQSIDEQLSKNDFKRHITLCFYYNNSGCRRDNCDYKHQYTPSCYLQSSCYRRYCP